MNVEEVKVKLLAETAIVDWQELEKFFAKQVLWKVSEELDLVEVATKMACDDGQAISALVQSKKLLEVDMEQAKKWSVTTDDLWAVVVSPWIIAQQRVKRKNKANDNA